jgi:deoxyribose-phosphate aldolase
METSTTIGFPHGGHTTSIKVAEAVRAMDDGCQELDMVVNISKVLSGDWDYVRQELVAVTDASHARQRKVKVIFENCYLKDLHKIRLCEICAEVGADWVKTSTGFGTSGATLEDVKLMRAHSPARVQVKAAGGIRDLDQLLEYRALGASRVGASRTKDILEDCRRRLIK